MFTLNILQKYDNDDYQMIVFFEKCGTKVENRLTHAEVKRLVERLKLETHNLQRHLEYNE